MSERAVSNTLGFVLIFTLVLMSLTLVSTAGLGGLEDTRDASMLKNAEQSMDSLATAMDDVHREGEERRTASIRLGRGQLLPGEETTITVEVGTGSITTYETTTRPIVYRLDDTQIVYEGSGLIREQPEGAVMLRRPSFRLDSDGMIIPLVNTTATRQGAIRGSNAQIALRRVNSTTKFEKGGPSGTTDVNLSIDTPSSQRAQAWKRGLNDQISGSNPCSISGGSRVDCDPITLDGTLIVREVAVAYTFSG